jgi:hypothetical protein
MRVLPTASRGRGLLGGFVLAAGFERTLPIDFELSSTELSVRLGIRRDVGTWPLAEQLQPLDAAARNQRLADAFFASLGVQLE